MTEKQSFRRTQYVTDFSLQFRFILVTLVTLLVFFGLSLWVIYATGWAHLVERLSNVYPQGRLMEILRLIYFRLAIGLLLLMPVALLVTVFLSHTIAGPLVRIKRYLRLMAKGEFELSPLLLRRYDELKEVASLINEITQGVAPRLQERKRLLTSLQNTVGMLRNDLQRLPSVGQEIHRKLSDVTETLRALERTLQSHS